MEGKRRKSRLSGFAHWPLAALFALAAFSFWLAPSSEQSPPKLWDTSAAGVEFSRIGGEVTLRVAAQGAYRLAGGAMTLTAASVNAPHTSGHLIFHGDYGEISPDFSELSLRKTRGVVTSPRASVSLSAGVVRYRLQGHELTGNAVRVSLRAGGYVRADNAEWEPEGDLILAGNVAAVFEGWR